MKVRRSSSEMFPLIEKWERSGQTREAFCASHNLTIGLFAYWRKKYVLAHSSDDKASATSFVPIEFPTMNSGSVLELSRGDFHLHFSQLPDVGYLKELLS